MIDNFKNKQQIHKIILNISNQYNLRDNKSFEKIKTNANKYLKENNYNFTVTYLTYKTNCIIVNFSNDEYVMLQLN